MKYIPTLRGTILTMLCMSLTLTSCSYNQFGAVATGSSLGGMLGSSIGGLMGGPRGSDKGTIAGMVLGGAVGAVATATRNQHNQPRTVQSYNSSSQTYQDDAYNSSSSGNDGVVSYDTYNSSRYRVPSAAHSDLEDLEVSNIHFLDDNNNQRLDDGERALIVFDISNRGAKTLYNVAPNITCSSKRVAVSPAATIASVLPGQGIRYTASVVAVRRLKDAPLRFTVSFGTGKQQVVVKTFEI